jgi:uncharacterized protein (TIGR03083 family)
MDHGAAMRLAETEYTRFGSLLEHVGDDDWTRATDCTAWDVRAMAGHVLGMTRMAASIRETIRQQRLAGRAGGLLIDALTDLQVREQSGLTPGDLVSKFRRIAPRAARSRRRIPSFVRDRRMPAPQQVGDLQEWWSFGFLLDIVMTRDPWMHRVDISRAMGVEVELTADHDGVLVADVVAEWSSRHGRPFDLALTGPAGGSWTQGAGGPRIEMDAVDFCRSLSGRHDASGLLATQVPF